MTKIPLLDTKIISSGPEQYGELVWPKFYGPSIYMKNINLFRMILFPIMYISIGIIILINGFFMPSSYYRFFQVSIGSLFIVISIWLPIKIIRILRKETEKDPVRMKMLKNWDWNWDLYENGILVKNAPDMVTNTIEYHFIKFSDISKAYIKPSKENIKILFELIKEYNLSKAQKPEDAPVSLSVRWKNMISKRIWFVDINGKLLGTGLDEKRFENLKKFESILRQKVRDVE